MIEFLLKHIVLRKQKLYKFVLSVWYIWYESRANKICHLISSRTLTSRFSLNYLSNLFTLITLQNGFEYFSFLYILYNFIPAHLLSNIIIIIKNFWQENWLENYLFGLKNTLINAIFVWYRIKKLIYNREMLNCQKLWVGNIV